MTLQLILRIAAGIAIAVIFYKLISGFIKSKRK